MSEHRELLLDSVGRMMSERCGPDAVAAAEEQWPAELWSLVEDAGLPLAPLPEDAGGGGADAVDSFALARLTAASALPLPLGETGLLAGHALAQAGLEVPSGPLAAVWRGVRATLQEDAVSLSGTAERVPWGARAARVAVLAEAPDGLVVCSVDPNACTVHRHVNLAGEPRDTLVFDAVLVAAGEHAAAPAGLTAELLDRRAALLRAAQISGALRAASELSVTFASERVQFGRPIAAFQAVGSLLALLAGEAAAADGAVDAALAAFGDIEQDGDVVAAAKIRAGQAAGAGAEMAHQIHGAIGYTREHRLHHLTRRLWSWRDEYGSEAVWAQQLGRSALAAGGDGVWPLITGTRRHR